MRSVLVALMLAACGGEGGPAGDAGVPDVVWDPGGDPIGGWSNAEGLYACFDDSSYAAFGDDPEEVLMPMAYVTWTTQGMLYFQLGGGTGQWRLVNDQLIVWLENCSMNCGPFRYTRDEGLTCFDF